MCEPKQGISENLSIQIRINHSNRGQAEKQEPQNYLQP